MRLASDNSWARHHLKQLSWRSQWIILCTLEQRMVVSCEISRDDQWLFGLSSSLSTRSSTAMNRTRSTAAWLPDSVPVLRFLFSRLSMLPSFGQFTQQPSCTVLLWQTEIFYQNRKFLLNFHDFVQFLLIFGSWQFPKVKLVHKIGDAGK